MKSCVQISVLTINILFASLQIIDTYAIRQNNNGHSSEEKSKVISGNFREHGSDHTNANRNNRFYDSKPWDRMDEDEKKEVADMVKVIRRVSTFVDWEDMKTNYLNEYELIQNKGTRLENMRLHHMPFNEKENKTRQLKRKRKRPKGEASKTKKASKSKHPAKEFFFPTKAKGHKQELSTISPTKQPTTSKLTQAPYIFIVETVAPESHSPSEEKYHYSKKSKKSKYESSTGNSSKSKYSSIYNHEYGKGGVKGKKCKTPKYQNEDDDYYYSYYDENEDEDDDAGEIAYGRRLKRPRKRTKKSKNDSSKKAKSREYGSLKTPKSERSNQKSKEAKNHSLKSNKRNKDFDAWCDEFETFPPSSFPSISNHPTTTTSTPSESPIPTRKPTPTPSRSPDSPPVTPNPTNKSTPAPTKSPTPSPTKKPTPIPTRSPASDPTSESPSRTPSILPSSSPSTPLPTREQIYRYDRGVCPNAGEFGVPCSDENLRKICDKYDENGSFQQCWNLCKPSFCCIHDADPILNPTAPSCSTDSNCAQYAYCYVVWFKFHDTIGPAPYWTVEQEDDFYDLDDADPNVIRGDIDDNVDDFYLQLYFHHFDTDAEVFQEAGAEKVSDIDVFDLFSKSKLWDSE